jgi:Na+-driven multidrug efflux pump|tara:strand:- start:44 stop:430 length:387 start_codon:yes stop_codon:yes gene_type:complete
MIIILQVSIAFGALVMGLAGGILLVSREQLGAIFVKQGAVDTARGGSAASDKVSSDAIRALVAKLAPYAAAFAAADGVQGVAQGVLRGCGMQRTIAIANFCGFWVIGVPTGFYLCFTKSLGVQGASRQ